jgi:cell division protein ZapA (FtsZ GTPase activity inhibitor)
LKINNYRHLQEVANKKDRTIIELEAKKRRLEQYLSMSLEAINTLKNLGLFNRLFNKVPEGIDELQEDIKKLQPPKEIEIEPVRIKKTSDVLGEKQ